MSHSYPISEAEYRALRKIIVASGVVLTSKAQRFVDEEDVLILAELSKPRGFDAIVLDRNEVKVSIHWEANGPQAFIALAQCSCSKNANISGCVHKIALALELLKNAPLPEATKQEPKPRKEKAVAIPLSPLEEKIRRHLGGKLTPAGARLADRVTGFWQRKQGVIALNAVASVLEMRLGHWEIYNAPTVTLWSADKPPVDAWDTLQLMLYAIQQNRWVLPAFLSSLLDPERLEIVTRPVRRLREIAHWKQLLSGLPEDAEQVAAFPTLRFCLTAEGVGVEWKPNDSQDFVSARNNPLRDMIKQARQTPGRVPNQATQIIIDHLADRANGLILLPWNEGGLAKLFARLMQLPAAEREAVLFTERHEPIPLEPGMLQWKLTPPPAEMPDDYYELDLLTSEGSRVPQKLLIVPGQPTRVITLGCIYQVGVLPVEPVGWKWPLRIDPEVMESKEGVKFLQLLNLPLPVGVIDKVQRCPVNITVRCQIDKVHGQFQLDVQGVADWGSVTPKQYWQHDHVWAEHRSGPTLLPPVGKILVLENHKLPPVGAWLSEQFPRPNTDYGTVEDHSKPVRPQAKEFPTQMIEWLSGCPDGVVLELDPELASLRHGQVSGTFRLDFEPSGVDWFDLKLDLQVSDTSLTEEEINLLLNARGKWVRLADKGWRKLDFQLTEEQERELAELGLVSSDFGSTPEKQRLHVLQLAGTKSRSLINDENAAMLTRRASEIQTSVTPPIPKTIKATLRPYQETGYHFLAYLTTNRFGGILADDMGLGKTLQALTWIAWLHETPLAPKTKRLPSLVVCPKSVMDNWRTEAARFFPALKVQAWSRDATGSIGSAKAKPDLLIIHYQQLRQHEALLQAQGWLAVILDEAQYIKNPASQTTKSACGLRAEYRLALSGTPVENRLLDLWSIMSFAQPGALGSKSYFAKNFDSKNDSLARRRLAARVRPFLLRRTKKEVASDLPDRTEEDLICEMDGTQAALYQAELKRARTMLLKANTSKALDGMRFHILSSLLRLRQICCHPSLIGIKDKKPESAKLDALMDLLEPLMEEGYKVLIFSQFVEMLELIKAEITAREWPQFLLTGSTDDRGALVEKFQAHEGHAVFLISLKAGGAGLNLTAASYVVLFDPWWNPAVEAQAIDRTHRIGQTQNVMAYRLLVKDSIEEKIRQLQKQKSALADDVLGEDAGSALTLADFKFLLGGAE
jgi:hypothetical protein